MIILDTNVLSELMKPQPDKEVLRWVDSQLSIRPLSKPARLLDLIVRQRSAVLTTL